MSKNNSCVNILDLVHSRSTRVICIADLDEYLLRELENPPKVYDKSSRALWNFAFSPKQENVLQDNCLERKALNTSFSHSSILMLDYDSGVTTPEAFKEMFSAFTFYLYTSFNHTVENPRFRAILPIEKPLSKYQLAAMKNAEFVQRIFGDVDKTCFEISRYFFMPMINMKAPEEYRYFVNRGCEFRFDERALFELDFIVLNESRKNGNEKRYFVPRIENSYSQMPLEKIDLKIGELNINARGLGRGLNRKIYGLFMWLVKVLGSEEAARSHLLQHARHPTTMADIRNCRAKVRKSAS